MKFRELSQGTWFQKCKVCSHNLSQLQRYFEIIQTYRRATRTVWELLYNLYLDLPFFTFCQLCTLSSLHLFVYTYIPIVFYEPNLQTPCSFTLIFFNWYFLRIRHSVNISTMQLLKSGSLTSVYYYYLIPSLFSNFSSYPNSNPCLLVLTLDIVQDHGCIVFSSCASLVFYFSRH